MRLQPGGAEAVLQSVLTDGAAQRAGLAPGDTLIAVDGLRATRDNLDALIAHVREGASVRVHAFRRDALTTFDVRPLAPPADTCELSIAADAPDAASRRRAAWLGGGA